MLWKQVDKGRAVGEGNWREGSHAAQVIDFDEWIGEIAAASRRRERGYQGKDVELERMVKKSSSCREILDGAVAVLCAECAAGIVRT